VYLYLCPQETGNKYNTNRTKRARINALETAGKLDKDGWGAGHFDLRGTARGRGGADWGGGVVCVKCQVSTSDGRKCQPSGGATERGCQCERAGEGPPKPLGIPSATSYFHWKEKRLFLLKFFIYNVCKVKKPFLNYWFLYYMTL